MSKITNAESRRIIQRARFATYLVDEFIVSASQTASIELPKIISNYDFTNMTLRELNSVGGELRARFNLIWGDMWDSINSQLDPFAMDEVDFTSKLYSQFTESILKIPSLEIVLAAINNSVLTLTSGDTTKAGKWAQFINQNIKSTYGLVDGVVKIGYQEGQTNDEIVRLLRGTYNRATKTYSGGILTGKSVSRADALVRTGVAHYSAITRDKLIQANSDIFESRILYATFDSRTTLICQGRHLKEWDISNKDYPRLPFHFGERSIYLFRLVGESDPFSGLRASKGSKGGSQVDADLTMGEWLKTQPEWFVEETLGKERARLFLDGRLPIDKFTDLQGRVLTLDELKETTAGKKAYGRLDD